ncbi:MAG: CBS domain-containing protein [Candidatus Woesearchaeota archaeon]
MEELSELKKIRKKLGITQQELAKKANVSQSLIAKIESGKIDPSYSYAKKIFETLTLLNKETELTAKDIMHRKIYSIKTTDSLKEAIDKMKKHNISQMPVIKNKKVVGYISESLILNAIMKNNPNIKISEIMESSPPIVPENTSQGVIINLLQHFPLVLVEEKGELVGIITKADLIKIIYK